MQLPKRKRVVREVRIEDYLVDEMAKIGFRCDKYKTPGRRNAPDRICLGYPGWIFFVECKRPNKWPTDAQFREHERLRKMGFRVEVVNTKEQVDDLVRRAKCGW
jgi:hypothetical protein